MPRKTVGRILFAMLLGGQLAMPRVCAQGLNGQDPPGDASGPPDAVPGQLDLDTDFVKRHQDEPIDWRIAVKTGLLALMILVWVRTGDWVNYDTQVFGLGHRKWNSIIFFPFSTTKVGCL